MIEDCGYEWMDEVLQQELGKLNNISFMFLMTSAMIIKKRYHS